jgi:cellulose synthase/poly-beta-1,6-N-acetylglucosamine synthase-like glycosyltransferase/peptidoglycan/xylan/chitin deacetylase (PgdA/CDA1 family)
MAVKAPMNAARVVHAPTRITSEKRTFDTISVPVFYDKTGKRLRRFIEATVVLAVVVFGLLSWITPMALAPAWRVSMNTDSGYPRRFLSAADLRHVPVIGDIDGGVFNRVVKVVRRDGVCAEDQESCSQLDLVDPFSNEVYRTATEDEAAAIGHSPYAIEHFGRPPDHQLMLTFDDGPDPTFTPQVLDILSQERVPATFFLIGESVAQFPEVFRRIVREGHMAGNHTLSHPSSFSANSDIRNREELIGADRIMRAVAGYDTSVFRIPKGDPDHNALALLQAQQLGYLHVDADIDTEDWKLPPGAEIPVPQLDGHGHVVLMHDGGADRASTVRLLRKLIAEARTQGYTFTTLAPLLPPRYRPTKSPTPSLADPATLLAVQAVFVAPKMLLKSLFWLGIGSLTIMSILYLVLALIGHHRRSRTRCPVVPDDKLPFVTVVVPAYNEEEVICKTLAQLRRSDYPATKLEVIAVNDGSTDSTMDTLEDCADEWPQLRIVSQDNCGKPSALNNGISRAREESTVIVTIDADTLVRTATVRMLARHFVAKHHAKRLGAVAGHVKVGNRRNIITAWQSLEYISGICVTRMAEGMMNAIWIVPGACSAWARDALTAMGGFRDDTMAEDTDATLMLQKLGYLVRQEEQAVADTEAPETIKALAKQRKRWTFGNMQALWKHRAMMLRPRYGLLGMLSLPYALLSLVVPLIFLPVAVVAVGMNIAEGNWRSIALFAGFVAVLHLVISIAAIAIARERVWHLLVVPIYRVIYEPLRAYLLYAAAYRVIKGTIVQWDKLERRNSVGRPPAVSRTHYRPVTPAAAK